MHERIRNNETYHHEGNSAISDDHISFQYQVEQLERILESTRDAKENIHDEVDNNTPNINTQEKVGKVSLQQTEAVTENAYVDPEELARKEREALEEYAKHFKIHSRNNN